MTISINGHIFPHFKLEFTLAIEAFNYMYWKIETNNSAAQGLPLPFQCWNISNIHNTYNGDCIIISIQFQKIINVLVSFLPSFEYLFNRSTNIYFQLILSVGNLLSTSNSEVKSDPCVESVIK